MAIATNGTANNASARVSTASARVHTPAQLIQKSFREKPRMRALSASTPMIKPALSVMNVPTVQE